jgi:2-polyprenyl-3-methyl-5-hydroxy-6-metoxy-1,4-benzoquinol methylase
MKPLLILDIDETLIADFCDIEDIRYLEKTYEKESFDAVVVHDVIHHLETKEDYLLAINSLKFLPVPCSNAQ